jgi:serine/threonine protein kinase
MKESAPLANFGARKVPPELQRIVSKALAKNPNERYQTAKDMLIDLRNLKKRLELDLEIERSASPDSGALPATTGKNVIPRTDSTEAGRSETEPGEGERRSRRKLVPWIAVMSVLVVGLIIAASWSRLRRSTLVGPAPASSTASERKPSYWITVQKYRNGRPFEDPFRLASEINFEKDYKVRLNVAVRSPGIYTF